MNVAGITKIVVNENKYSIESLPPAKALGFGIRAATVLGPILGQLVAIADSKGTVSNTEIVGLIGQSVGLIDADKLQKLVEEALEHCYTPTNESLADTAVYDRWFNEHKSDLLVLGVRAVYALAKDFFPKGLGI